MRSILCPADATPSFDNRLETALALARATGGHLTLQIATPVAEMAVWEPFGGAVLSAGAINAAREADRELGEKLKVRLAPQDVPFDVDLVDVGRIEGLAAAARFADVIVTGLDDPTIEEVSLGVRCPVLAIPEAAPMVTFDGPVMIAWDGGHESANAMRASLPLLHLASHVHVLTVAEKSAEFPASDALCYLSRHGIHAELHEVSPAGTISATIEANARRLGAGLIVMGVYGHSRLRELLLGGVSRDLLDNSSVPLLLAH
ncbi:MAG: universal stress protein [Sphingomonadales bacterium]|nr:universal stress protein [Sphingomonadales bacterium]MDE2570009.1 universal stress protein [Sphingomonadales bacterium]